MAGGASSLTRAAASSIASGRPSSRWQIATSGGGVVGGQFEVRADSLGAIEEKGNGRGGGQLLDRRELARVGQGQGRDRILALAAQAQGGPAGDEQRQVRAGGQQLGRQGDGADELLEVIEDDQDLAAGQGGDQPLLERRFAFFAQAEALGDHRQGDDRVAGEGQGDEGDTAREVGPEQAGQLQRQPGLADAAGAGQGDETHILAAQQIPDRGQLGVAAQNRRQGAQEVAAGWRARSTKTAIVYASVFAAFLPASFSPGFAAALLAAVFLVESAWYALVAPFSRRQAPNGLIFRASPGLIERPAQSCSAWV